MRGTGTHKPWSRPLADLVDGCIAPTLAKHGFAEAGIITCWREIAGDRVASFAEPLRVQRGRPPSRPGADGTDTAATLILRVESGFGIEVQHLAAALIERINLHVGWRCIGRVAIRQGPLRARAAPLRPAAALPDPVAVERARDVTVGIADDALRGALVRLGARAMATVRRNLA